MKISIVTITYNNAEGVNRTLASVAKLAIPENTELECIVVDGASSDHTREIVEKYMGSKKDGLSILYKSEPDQGIYDAMNKGIDRATGDWIIFMNAGDCFFSPDVIMQLSPHLSPEYDVFYGDAVCDYKGRYYLWCGQDDIGKFIKFVMPMCHQACVYSCRLLKQEKYSLSYGTMGDYELAARLVCQSRRFHHISVIVALYEYGGVSAVKSEKAQVKARRIQKKYHLISASEYRKRMVVAKPRAALFALIPKKLLQRLKEKRFDNETKNWTREFEKVVPKWYNEK